MFETVEFVTDKHCFKRGDRFEFRPGINLLVGEQGSGKSTLLSALRSCADPDKEKRCLRVKRTAERFPMRIVDFERDNPRTKGHFEDDNFMFQVASKFRSHGETHRAILASVARDVKPGTVLVLDEPDASLSPRSVHALAKTLADIAASGSQVIVSAHNPILISSAPEVLSLEHRRWMSPTEFLELHR